MMTAEREAELHEALLDMVFQFAYRTDGPALWTGGLSALEKAFEVLDWDDPHPVPEICCDEPNCNQASTCGWPGVNGYRRTCSKHAYWNVKP